MSVCQNCGMSVVMNPSGEWCRCHEQSDIHPVPDQPIPDDYYKNGYTDAVAEIARLKAELEAVTAQRDDAQGMIHGARELVRKSLRALKHADKAITREAWQSGPTIEEARKVILDASKNIEEYGVDGYANALRLARSLCVGLKGERDAANADADLLARFFAKWTELERASAGGVDMLSRGQISDELVETASRIHKQLLAMAFDVEVSPTAMARVERARKERG